MPASFSLMAASDKTDIHVHQSETIQYTQKEQNGMINGGVPSDMNSRTSGKHVRAIYTPLNPTFIQKNWGMQGYTFFFLFLF